MSNVEALTLPLILPLFSWNFISASFVPLIFSLIDFLADVWLPPPAILSILVCKGMLASLRSEETIISKSAFAG